MLEIVGLNLQKAKDGHNLANRNSGLWLQQVEQTWNVLLHI
jgi:hypothetical protein